MSTSRQSVSESQRNEPPRWFLGIPWTSLDLRNALEQAKPTTDEDRKWCKLAKADKNDYPSALFFWARGDIGMTIERDLDRAYPEDALDPVTDERVLVMVLRTKSGAVAECDLDDPDSPDLGTPFATDAQVAELRNKGWLVRWYKEDKDSKW